MKVNRDQAAAFLASLYPNGEQCYLSNHTRSYFSGLIGQVPANLPVFAKPSEEQISLAAALRGIADHLEKGAEHD